MTDPPRRYPAFNKKIDPEGMKKLIANLSKMKAPRIPFRPWVNMEPITGYEGQSLGQLVMEHKTHLGETNLSGAILSCLDLSGAYLSQANLAGGGDLFLVDFKNAKLHHSDLTHANLSYAVLCGATLFGAKIEGANFKNAKYDEETEWPTGFDPVAAGAILREKNDY